MCEFKVSLIAGAKREKVAEDIVQAKLIDGSVVLSDVLGYSKTVHEAMIGEVDVGKEVMVLRTAPILSKLIRFYGIYDRCLEEGRFDIGLESAWEAVKAEGDALIRSLSKRQGT